MEKKGSNYSARETALQVLYSVKEKGAYSNLALDQWLGKTRLDSQNKGFVTELVYGVLRWEGKIDWIICCYLKTPFDKLPIWIKLILRLGVYQMVETMVPPSAAVNESVNLARKYGHSGTVRLVNGILRNVSRNLDNISYPLLDQEPTKYVSVMYSHPYWMVERWISRYGIDETIALCQSNNKPQRITLRVNTLKSTKQDILKQLAQDEIMAITSKFVPDGVKIEEGGFSPRASNLFRQGMVVPQDDAAILVGHLMAPKEGQTVIDCCAAPGGKTTHLAQLMNNQGVIYAFDIHPHRVALIEQACRQVGTEIVKAELGDARKLGEIYPNQFDLALIDAPCSGLGVLRRKPDARWRKHPEQLKQFPLLQLEILTSGSKIVKPGGSIVYSTCSIEPEENEQVIQLFLANNPDFSIVKPEHYLSFIGDRSIFTEQGFVRTYPHRHGVDGFFMARLQRKGD